MIANHASATLLVALLTAALGCGSAEPSPPARVPDSARPAPVKPPPAAPTADSLIGIWVSQTTFGPAVRGELTVVRDGSTWRATLAGNQTSFQVTGKSVRFTLPGDAGGFRGALSADARAISGVWMRPPLRAGGLSDPGGTGQPFGSPLVLPAAGKDTWRGAVEPLESRFTIYLRIFRDADGSIVGAFRNHDANSTGGASRFRVSRGGTSVELSARFDDSSPEIRHTATLSGPDRMRITWPDLGGAIDFDRRTPAEVPGFFPRPPGDGPYLYAAPPATGDGWVTGRAAEVGMDEAALAAVVQRLIDADPSIQRPALIHSLLVARRGKLVLEEYFFGFGRDTPHDLRSAGKTFASVMLGAAMKQGKRVGPDTRVYRLLAGMGPFANPDPRKAKITLGHLMTHTSGLACDDNDDASPGNEGTMESQQQQPDWWKYTLDLPVAHDPGTRYAYCSANMNLVGAALTTTTATSLPELFERTVARPLDFGPYHWNLMPTGEGYLGGGAFLRPRDLLKVGQVYLDGGVWRGRRVVAASWVKRSTAPQVAVTPATTGLDAETFPNFYGEGNDGYAWHLNRVNAGGRTYREFEANGNGGQLLIVLPELDMVVVFTAANYRQGGIWGRWRDQIVGGEIIPAIRR